MGKFILHTDGAQSYGSMPGGLDIRRDTVSHRAKGGGPFFTKQATRKNLKLSSGKKGQKTVTAGAQSLDGFLQHPKKNCFGIQSKAPQRIHGQVRESQWMHWLGSTDPWGAVGQFRDVREKGLS
eukprot:TRINITY_DN24360_c0_g1_i1.p1 TRINITY_DN24360_c0_g1~~TRINITY_DN24360_c0_g1_i1.p1  ORF type:complete len:124 (-),score=21.86 TRINITY_DN24360_c0_g1_i1:24-395(-)